MQGKQWEGRVVDGRFHLRQYLGGSARSAVFLTEFGDGTPQEAAIKLALADTDSAYTWMLEREFAARLSHPGLVRIFHYGTCRIDDSGLVYSVMERSDENLSQVVPTRPLTSAEGRELLMSVVEILAYVHAEGFVHGHLTPSNIMAAGDRIKISSDGLTRAGESRDVRAQDIWRLGMTLVEALTQRAPSWDGSAGNDPATPQTLEEPFREIARGCLRSNPHARISLAEISRVLSPVPKLPPSPTPPPPSVPRRKYLLPVAGAVVLAAIVTGAVLKSVRPGEPPPATSPVATPAATPAAPAAGEVIPAEVRKEPAASKARAAALPSGDALVRYLPEVPAEYLATISGSVRVSVRVTVDPSGAVTDAQLNSRPASRYFDRVSLEAARRWKFKPAGDAAPDAESTRLVGFEFRRGGCTAF